MAAAQLRGLFGGDPDRLARFSLRLDDLLLDDAKNRITGETMGLLFDLARAAGLEDWRTRMFAGDRINVTDPSLCATAPTGRS